MNPARRTRQPPSPNQLEQRKAASNQSTRPIQHAAVLADVKAKPSVAAETRPALTSAARVGRVNTRSGRKKACGAVEQKKCCKEEQ
jgi:hypothetical protein